MRLVVIDTGVSSDVNFEKKNVGIRIVQETNGFRIDKEYIDEIGHGTSVVDIIRQYATTEVEIYAIKLYDKEEYIDIKKLVFALNYVVENVICDVVQISSGVLISSPELYEVIRKLIKKNVLVVAAFDNDGGISYPAAYEEVLGVDLNLECKDKEKYEVLEDDVVDVRVGCGYYRTIDNKGKHVILEGASFANSYIVAMIANSVTTDFSKKAVKKSLGIVSVKEKRKKGLAISFSYDDFSQNVKKVVVFPFNKEIHSIARYENELAFSSCSYYDIKHKFIVGKKISQILHGVENDHIINDIDSLDWTGDFDMFICGHVLELEKLTGKKYRAMIYKMCKKHNKKLYCFDNMADIIPKHEYGRRVYFPYFDLNDVPANRYGKLRKPGIPVVAIIGTSSRQGKYTIQLSLKKGLEEKGVNVGFLSTEPTGYLLGASQMLPFGYDASCYLGNKLTNVLNELVWNIEKLNKEIVITGCQSGTLHYDTLNDKMLTYNQFCFLIGINPDGLVLCVNEFDDVEYVKNTISYARAITGAEIIMVVISGVNNPRLERNPELELYFEKIGVAYRRLEQLKQDELVDNVINYYL